MSTSVHNYMRSRVHAHLRTYQPQSLMCAVAHVKRINARRSRCPLAINAGIFAVALRQGLAASLSQSAQCQAFRPLRALFAAPAHFAFLPWTPRAVKRRAFLGPLGLGNRARKRKPRPRSAPSERANGLGPSAGPITSPSSA